MQEEFTKTTQGGLTSPQGSSDQTQRKPAIRTMRSDVEELTRSAVKPPAFSIAQNLAATPRTKTGATLSISSLNQGPPYVTTRTVGFVLIGVLLLLLLAAGGYFYDRGRKNQEPQAIIPPPQGSQTSLQQTPIFFATESQTTIALTGNDRQGFLDALKNESSLPGRAGTVKRLTIKLQDGPQERLMTVADFLEILGAQPPSQFLDHMGLYPSFFIFYGPGGGRIGFVAKTRDGNRALRDLFLWENTLISSFKPLFFGEELDLGTNEFEDRIYKNIDWRFSGLSSKEDLGIGYTVFPAKNLLVITTGKEALETIISRLLNEG